MGIALVVPLHQMDQHFGVCFRGKDVALVLELLPQREVVLDDAVVDQGDASGAIDEGVGVLLGRLPTGGPAGVPDAHATIPSRDGGLDLGHLALVLEHLQAIRCDRYADRIVTAVLQAPQSIQQDVLSHPLAGVTYDAAHQTTTLLFSRLPETRTPSSMRQSAPITEPGDITTLEPTLVS